MADDFDVDDAAARHAPHELFQGQSYCDDCGKPWPCDAAQALDVIREQQSKLEKADLIILDLREELRVAQKEVRAWQDGAWQASLEQDDDWARRSGW